MKNVLVRSLLLSMGISVAVAQDDIPYGLEFVSGIRASYHQNGIVLADNLIDLQLQSNITLAEDVFLNIALWQGAEISGDFQEFGAVGGITKIYDKFSLSGEVAVTSYESDIVEGGVELSLVGEYVVAENVFIFGSLGYHSGAETVLANLGGNGSVVVTDDSFLEWKAVFHLADSYFSREGLYDLTTRVSYTYNLNSFLSVTPFLSASIPLEGDADFNLSAGLWMEVFF